MTNWVTIQSWTYGEMVAANKFNQQLRDNMTALLGYTQRGDIIVATSHFGLVPKHVGVEASVYSTDFSDLTTGTSWAKSVLPYCSWKNEAYSVPDTSGQDIVPETGTNNWKGNNMNVGSAPFTFTILEDAFYLLTASFRGHLTPFGAIIQVRFRGQVLYLNYVLSSPPSNFYYFTGGWMHASDYMDITIQSANPTPQTMHFEFSLHQLCNLN